MPASLMPSLSPQDEAALCTEIEKLRNKLMLPENEGGSTRFSRWLPATAQLVLGLAPGLTVWTEQVGWFEIAGTRFQFDGNSGAVSATGTVLDLGATGVICDWVLSATDVTELLAFAALGVCALPLDTSWANAVLRRRFGFGCGDLLKNERGHVVVLERLNRFSGCVIGASGTQIGAKGQYCPITIPLGVQPWVRA